MSYYSLPIERRNEKIPTEYCYIGIAEYPDNYFKPKNGKKFTKEESEERDRRIDSHNKTIAQLNKGYCNLFNNEIELHSVLNGSLPILDADFTKETIYVIQPTASRKGERNYYTHSDKYTVSEFNVISKVANQKELVNRLIEDKLINRFASTVFDKYSYGNEGYSEILYNWFNELKTNHPETKICLSDILLDDNYEKRATSHFIPNSIYPLTIKNVEKLLSNNLIQYTSESDWYPQSVVARLLECGMTKVALEYINSIQEDDYKYFSKNKDIEKALILCSTDEYAKQIIKKLKIQLSGISLIITKYSEDGYGDDKTETIRFDNISEVKSYLIKKYDVPFEYLSKPDISKIQYGHYEFNIG